MINKKSLSFILIATIFVGIFIITFQSTLFSSIVQEKQQTNSVENEKKSFNVELIINYGNTDRPEIIENITVKEGQTALDLLQESRTVKTKEYSFGVLVESIDDIENGAANKYWIYSINGQEATTGASAYILQPNDQIKWEFKASEK